MYESGGEFVQSRTSEVMNITRRNVLGGLLTATFYLPAWKALGGLPVVKGAIRWDAWYVRSGASWYAQRSLNPRKFHGRAPIHCRELSASEIECVGTPDVMAMEIEAARHAGLDYWAFVWYPEREQETQSLRRAWELYQSSSNRHLINWCLIVPISEFGSYPYSPSASRRNIESLLRLLSQENYQRVLGNRPLLYIMWNDADVVKYFDGSMENVARAFRNMRDWAASQQIGNPYLTIMAGAAKRSATVARATVCDAISNYISSFSKRGARPFSELVPQVEAFWRDLSSTHLATIPIAMVGWDTRPRLEQPVPWQQSGAVTDQSNQQYYLDATPNEFAAHVQRAVDFVRALPQECPARTVLIYSWNECDEGGCILPTLGDPAGAYLRALTSVQ